MDIVGVGICFPVGFCIYCHQNRIGSRTTTGDSSLQVRIGRFYFIDLYPSDQKKSDADRETMDPTWHLRRIEYQHLSGLLCVCDAIGHSRYRSFGSSYQSGIDQRLVDGIRQKQLTRSLLISLLLGTAGVLIASWPNLQHASISISGLLILLFSMISYSVAAIYFSSQNWEGLSRLTINGWQTF